MDETNSIFSGELSVPASSHAEMYKAVYDQLQKDFHPFTQLREPDQDLSAQFLYNEVAYIISELLRTKPSELNAILYRVDISEAAIKRGMQLTSPEKKLDQLTWMILKREAQKVWIRRNYK